jgi:hypothetical protein
MLILWNALRLRTDIMGLLDLSNVGWPRRLLLWRIEAARKWKIFLLTMGAGTCRAGCG